MRVCVYAIMRDEAANVAGWAESTIEADERLVVDTGSTDDTMAALDEARVDVAPAVFEPFRFDDARNTALALAPPADLYLRLDADERLAPGWRDEIEAVHDPHVARYRYLVRNHGVGWAVHTRDDLHVRHGMRWKYPTHEVLVGAGPVLDLPRFVVEHHPPAARRPHHYRNLVVLQAAVGEYPGDHRMAFYFGRELWYTGNWEACRVAMMGFLDLPGGWAAERAEAYRILAAIDDFPERWLWRAVGECPERREPWCDLARLRLQQGEVARAAAMWDEARQRDDETLYTTDPACWGEAFELLGLDIAHHLADAVAPT